MSAERRPLPSAAVLAIFLALPAAVEAFSTASVRFFGTGGGTAVDRIKIRVDPPVPADVGSGDFTMEIWLRGRREDNDTPTDGYRDPGQRERAAIDWIYGNIFVDRDTFGPGPDWGMSIHRDGSPAGAAVLRFGTESGDGTQHTLQGTADVLNDEWHHVAFVRERESGVKRIFVDGELDVASAADAAPGDLSYPNDRATGYPDSDPFLVLGAEKHGFTADAGAPSFDGFVDDVRLWSVARTGEELRAAMRATLPGDTPGLALYLRVEEGAGQVLADAAGGDPATLFAGVPGNGEWSTETPPAVSTTTTVLSATTTTTVPQACALDAECDDGDACTADRCPAGTCSAEPIAGAAGVACRVERLASGALCSAAEGSARLEAVADRRLERSRTLLLRAETAAGKRRRTLLRQAATQLAKIQRRAAKAARRAQIDPACAASIDGAAGPLRDAILALASS